MSKYVRSGLGPRLSRPSRPSKYINIYFYLESIARLIYDELKMAEQDTKYHKCGVEFCDRMCKAPRCRQHCYRLNNCAHENCYRKCRGNLCHHHTPEQIEKSRARQAARIMTLRQATGGVVPALH